MTKAESRRGAIGATWVLTALGLVVLATLPPQPEWPGQFVTSLLPRTPGEWFDVAQNLALYAPLGLVLAARRHSLVWICGWAAILSLGTELLQFVIPGRSPAARDVGVNTAGALIGYLAWWTPPGRATANVLRRIEAWLVRARHSGRRQASVLSFGWAVGVAAALIATAALLAPAPPHSGLWVASPYIDREQGSVRIGSTGMRGGSFKGLIDEVRIFDRSRPAEQIREDMLRPAAARSRGDQHLIAAFGFDANTGVVARDDTGRGHDGVVRGALWTAQGRLGGALAFDGVMSQVVVPHAPSFDLRDGMTLEAWIRPADYMGLEPAIISREGSLYYLEKSSAEGGFHAAGGGRFGTVPAYARLPESIPANAWTHLAVTYDGQVLRLYMNGGLAATHVHWSPHRPERVVLNGLSLPAGEIADPEVVRKLLLGDIVLDAIIACGKPAPTTGPLFVIVGLQDTQVLAMNAVGADLMVRPWTWARRLSLASPPSSVRDALGVCTPGRTIALTLKGRLQNPAVIRDGQMLSVAIPGLGSGWAFVIHADLLPGWLQLVATCAWLALLAAPLGFWARRTALTTIAIVLVAGACLATPYLLPVRSMNASELGAVAAGAALGAFCRRSTRHGDGSSSGLDGSPPYDP